MIRECRHFSAFNAQPECVVDVIETQAVQPRYVSQIGGRRRKTDPGRAIACARIAMAYRTILRIQGRATCGIRGDHRRLADFVRHCQLRAELTRLTGHLSAILLLVDRIQQRRDALLQLCALRLCRHRGDRALQCLEKLHLLAVLRVIHDLAIRDRRRVVRADVIEQMQSLSSVLGRRCAGPDAEHAQQHEAQTGQ